MYIHQKIKRNCTIFILFFSVLFVFSPVFAQKCYTEEGSTDLICGDSADPTILPTSQNQSCTNCFKYKTLVTIPGFTEQDGTVTISPNSLGLFLQTAFNYFIGVAILLTVVMIIYGGVLYATAEAMGVKTKAKSIITGALEGLALALGSVLILTTINPDLVKFNLALPNLVLQGQSEGGRGSVVDLQILGDGGVIPDGGSGGTNGAVSGAQARAREENLINAAKAAGITNVSELAGLVGNAKHESLNFTRFSEIGRGGGKHGNYYGRGYIQITGIGNYRAYSSAAGVDLVANPEAALREDISIKITIAYWKARVQRLNPQTNLEAGGIGINPCEKPNNGNRNCRGNGNAAGWANRQAAVRSYLSDPRLR